MKEKIIYLKLDADKNLISGKNPLSINQWNDFIDRYVNDDSSIVTPHNEELDGQFFVTTTLCNIENRRWKDDLKYKCRKTKNHTTWKNVNGASLN